MRLIRIVFASLWVLALAPVALAQTFAPPPSVDGCPRCKQLRDALDDIPLAVEQVKIAIARLDQEEQAYRADLAVRGARPGEFDRARDFAKRRDKLRGEITNYEYKYKDLLQKLQVFLRNCRHAEEPPPPVTQVPTPRVSTPSEKIYDVWGSVTDGGAWLGLVAIFETMFPDDFGEDAPNESTWERLLAEQLTTTSLCTECDPLVAPVESAIAALNRAKARLANIPSELSEIHEKLRQVRAALREVRDEVAKLQEQYPDSGDTTARTAFLRDMRLIEARAADPTRQFDALMNARRALKAEQSDLQARLPRLEDAIQAAKDALAICNGRCRADLVSLDRVVGYLGINPFNPKGQDFDLPPPDSGAAGFLQFSSPSFSGGEGGVVPIFVTRSGGSKGAVTVAYATRPGTASAADFGATSGTLSWADNDTTPKTFSVVLVEDTLVEGAETFSVVLTDPTGGAVLGNFSGSVVTIVDNDSPNLPPLAGNIQFASSTFSVAENGGAASIMVTRTGGSAGEVTVQVFTGAASATPGADYQAVAGVLTWGAGDTGVKTFSVPIVNDTLVEGPETFFVTLSNPTGQATLGAPATATVTIVDDDVNTGPCGAQANAWTPNAGSYACAGSCSPNPSPRLSVNGDIVTATSFASGGTATFQGCGSSLNSRESNLTYFGQSNHRATITRMSDTNFAANIVSSGGGTCSFTCNRTGP